LVSAIFVLTRLLESWRVAPDAAAHHVTILGQTLSYPTASAAAMYSVGIDPARVDFLLGESPSWRFPFALCLGSVALLGLLLAIAVFVGRLAHGSATLAPPFLSGQPCVVALAAITALGLLGTVYAGRRASTLSRRLSNASLTFRSQASTSGRPS
jgi:hypothetical protein